tara:strand:- start:13086 stop:14345 length:1260 start_codon:yes stop_codon:yes gene_type:complete
MRISKALSLATVSTFALSSFLISDANAAGFYLQEQSVSGLGNAFAGQVATPRDSSIVYFNPAGMAKLKGSHSNFGFHILAPSSDITNTGTTIPFGGATGGDGGNPYTATPIPNGSFSHESIEDKLWIGLAVSAPFGLENEYNDGWFGRFDSTKTRLTTIDIQPSFAVKLNDALSIGGGLNIQYVDADLQKIVNFTGPGGEVSSALNGDDMSFGYNVGLLYEPIEGTTLGAHYRSGVHHDLEGRVIVTGVANTPATAELDLPEIVQLGINHRVNDKLSVMAGATWFGWNSFEEIRVISALPASVTTQNYQTTWAFAVGAEYEYNDKWTLRAGYQFDETPTTDEYRTTLTPDGDRNWISTGATYKFNDQISLDMAATYIDIAKETINVARNVTANPATTANVRADSEGEVGILSFAVSYKF